MTVLSTLSDMWERNVRLFADRPAVKYESRSLTYRELVERARRLAESLARGGVRKRDRIAMLAMNCSEWFDFYACCEMHGFHAMTVNFRLAAPEVEAVLRDGAPKVLLFEAQYAEMIAGLVSKLTSIRRYICVGPAPGWAEELEAVIAGGMPEGPELRPVPEDPAHLIFTSGTTGRPKGVVRSQRAALALAESCAVSMNMALNGRGLIMMPLFHIGAQSMAAGEHWAGGTVVVARKFEPRTVARIIETERIDMTHMAPSMIRQFLDETEAERFDFASLETFCYAAAPMPLPLLRRCLQRFGSVMYDCYGSTETGNVAVLQKHFHVLDGAAESDARLASVGQEHQFARLRICDDDGRDCPIGTPGELCIRADAMMDGYWNNSTATVEAFRDGWYRSGDVAVMDSQGFVKLVDRMKDMIVSGGENIYSREVEEAIATHAGVTDVAVIGVPDETWGEAVMAIVERRAGTTLEAEAVVAHCRERIASYKKPRSVEFVDALPRLSTGKVNKVALRQRYRPN